jgi:hypothetical protein
MELAMSNANANSQARPTPTRPGWRRKIDGDVHVSSMAADVRLVPGTGSVNGEKAVASAMRDVLDRVRRSIRDRANRTRQPR